MNSLNSKVCIRCKQQRELKLLTFISEDKETTVELCNICLNTARQLWKNFLYPKERTKNEH